MRLWTRNFYYCHDSGSCYSDEFVIEEGYYGKVRYFSDNGMNFLIAPEEGVSDCPCGPRRQWFNYKNVACRSEDATTGQICIDARPYVIAVNCVDDYMELDPGRYRFCVLDCDYNPVTPGENDILLRVQQCVETRCR